MANSPETTATDSSLSTTPDSPPPSPPAASPIVAPPLRVKSSTPSTSSPANDSGTGFDPVDHAESGNTRSFDEQAVQVNTKSLAEVARGAVLTVSYYVNKALARTDEEQAADLWIARTKDQAQIGDPLAEIVGRKGIAGAVSPDMANLIEAGIGLVAYGIYHASKAWGIRRGLRKLAQAGHLPGPDQSGESA
jgi:post-segregation antitoxin (ccd killing protein)